MSISSYLISKALPKVREKYFTVKEDEVLVETDYEIPSSLDLSCSVSYELVGGRKFYYLNKSSEEKLTFFYFHGGGFVREFFDTQWKFLARLVKKTNGKVITPIYRLAPFGNIFEIYDYFIPYYQDYIVVHPDEKIVFIGDSAGGNIVSSIYLELIKRKIRLPDRLILISPWLDLTNSNPEIKQYIEKDPLLTFEGLLKASEYWCGSSDKKDPMFSPLYADPSLFKNTLVTYGDRELFYPDIHKFASLIGGESTNKILFKHKMNHVYSLYPIKEAKEALNVIVDFVK